LRVLAAPSARAGAIAPKVIVAARAAAVSVFFMIPQSYPESNTS
jgi:hypothetical protein